MKRIIIAVSVVLMLIFLLVGCNDGNNKNVYEQITPDEAKALMDSEDGYIILDVRTPEEFAERHIGCGSYNQVKSIEKSAVGISQCRMATSDSDGRFGIEEETVSGF